MYHTYYMFELCGYCGLEHDVGGEETLNGVPLKTCPMIAEGQLLVPTEPVAKPDVDLSWFDENNEFEE